MREQLLLRAEPVVASAASRHVHVSTPYQLLCSIPRAREAQRKARGLPAAPALAVQLGHLGRSRISDGVTRAQGLKHAARLCAAGSAPCRRSHGVSLILTWTLSLSSSFNEGHATLLALCTACHQLATAEATCLRRRTCCACGSRSSSWPNFLHRKSDSRPAAMTVLASSLAAVANCMAALYGS